MPPVFHIHCQIKELTMVLMDETKGMFTVHNPLFFKTFEGKRFVSCGWNTNGDGRMRGGLDVVPIFTIYEVCNDVDDVNCGEVVFYIRADDGSYDDGIPFADFIHNFGAWVDGN